MGKDGADLLELLAYSGCRLHEATELRWQDVDFDRGCLGRTERAIRICRRRSTYLKAIRIF
jgi:integrase